MILNSIIDNSISGLIDFKFCDVVTIEDIQLYDIKYYTSLISIEFTNIVSINRMNITNKNKDVKNDDINQLILDNFEKDIYNLDEQSRSLINIYECRNPYKYNRVLISIQEINADFGGYHSRFFNINNISHDQLVEIKITDSNFMNMHSEGNGGCIRIFENLFQTQLVLQIQSSKFYNCSSYLYGGAIYTNSKIILNDVVIQKSSSKFGGAILIFSQSHLQQQNLKFIDNYSKYYHQDIFLFWHISLNEIIEYSEINQNLKVNLKHIKEENYKYKLFPGIMYILPITMKTLIYPFENKDEQIFKNIKDEPLFQNLYPLVHKDNSFFPYLIKTNQNEYHQKPYLLIKVDSKFDTGVQQLSFKSTIGLFINFELNHCIAGQYSSTEYDCHYCPYMSASYQVNSTQCNQCDSQQFKYCHSNVSYLNIGYYRKQLTVDKDQIYECQYNQNSCIGGDVFGNQLCAQGHIGIECKSCDVIGKYWNETFGKNGYYSCIRCSELKHNIVLISILLIVFITVIYLIISCNIKSIEILIKQIYLQKLTKIFLGSSNRNLGLASIYVKILSFNVSILYMMQQQISIDYKNTLLDVSIQSQNPLVDGYISLDCALSQVYDTHDSFIKSKLLFFVLFPLFVVIIMIFLLFAKIGFKLTHTKLFLYSAVLSIIYLTFIIFYNSILSIVIDTFFCRTFKSGDQQSLLDLSVSCDMIETNYLIVIPTVIGYICGIPLFTFCALLYNRKKLQSIKVMFQYGFLYKDYKEKYFYWEILRFIVRLNLVFISKIFISNFINMNCINIVILILYLTCLLICKPFLRLQINKLELISILMNIQVIISLIVFQNQENSLENSIFPGIILMIFQYLSLLYIIGLFIMIINSFLIAIRVKLQKYEIFSRLFRCGYCLKKRINSIKKIENLKIFRKVVQRIIKKREKSIELQKMSYLYSENEETTINSENELNLNERINLNQKY